MKHALLVCIGALVIIAHVFIFHSIVKAEVFSGKSIDIDQRCLTAYENQYMLVVARSFLFPGFERMTLYKVNSEMSEKIATISGGYGSIVSLSETHCIVEAAIDWQPKKIMDKNQTFIEYNLLNKSERKLFSFARAYDHTDTLIRDRYCVFQNKLYFFKSGELLCLGDLNYYGPPIKQIIHTSVKICQQFDTALLINDGNDWLVFDGEDKTYLSEYDMGYRRGLNLIKIGNDIFISDNTNVCHYCIQDNYVVTKEYIYPYECAKIQSSLFYQNGVLYSIWEGCLYGYDIYKKQWSNFLQLKLKEHILDESEIAICNNHLYLVLQTLESSTKADLYCFDLRDLGKQETEQIIIKLMRVKKTSLVE